MLGKLIKYEIKAVYKVFLALLFVSIVAGVTHILTKHTYYNVNSFSLLIGSYTSLGYIAYIIMCFQKSLLGSEGYLMHTLPVKTSTLLLSKWIIYIPCFIIFSAIQYITMSWGFPYPYSGSYIFNNLHMYILFIAMFSIAFTIGHLFSKNRSKATIFLALGSFILLTVSNNSDKDSYRYFFIPVSQVLYRLLPIVTIIISIVITSYILKRKLNLE